LQVDIASTRLGEAGMLTRLFMKDGEVLQHEKRNHLNSLLIGNQKLLEIYLLIQSFRKLPAQAHQMVEDRVSARPIFMRKDQELNR